MKFGLFAMQLPSKCHLARTSVFRSQQRTAELKEPPARSPTSAFQGFPQSFPQGFSPGLQGHKWLAVGWGKPLRGKHCRKVNANSSAALACRAYAYCFYIKQQIPGGWVDHGTMGYTIMPPQCPQIVCTDSLARLLYSARLSNSFIHGSNLRANKKLRANPKMKIIQKADS